MDINMVFDEQWFKKYNWLVVLLARSWFGEWIFEFKKMGHYLDRKKIIRLTPNSVAELIRFKNDGRELEASQHFFERNEYAMNLKRKLYPLWMAFHIWDLFSDKFIPALSFGFSTLTVNPDSNSASCDGFAQRTGVDEAFGTIRGGAGTGSGTADLDYLFSRIVSSGTSNQYQEITRSFFGFYVASLAGTTGRTAVASFFGDLANWNKIDSFVSSYNIYSSTPAANNTLANADYSQAGTTAYSDTAIAGASWNDSGYNAYTLNTAGLAALTGALAGVLTMCGRTVQDASNTAPTWSATAQSRVGTIMSENGSNKPKLVVTYTAAVNTGNFFLAF